VHEAWLRCGAGKEELDSPSAWLVRLSPLPLPSASYRALLCKTRREESRGDRLPEPVALDQGPLGRIGRRFMFRWLISSVLQRPTPESCRARVLLLHDVFASRTPRSPR